ncbi:preprotein translocase subunit SecA [Georgenia subflava]|uniref:Preprotein translocase subunit SecA n=1 Tax=Georgenia subflava TaxID=1622177 RepID=A0A6N7EIV5_9MICO|nr:preprotein translocase subunit SecA [Georgenia subflava]MPV36948.1 preprotein translocase subunit SecA [Georgenia subflava]
MTTAEVDPLTLIAARMRGNEVWVRNTSYPDMVARTVRQLFSDSQVQALLRAELGFDANEAILVLDSCHDLQVEKLNLRMQRMVSSIDRASASGTPDAPKRTALEEARRQWAAAWDAEAHEVTVAAADLAAHCDLPEGTVTSVLNHFRLDVGQWSPRQVIDEFVSGNNPLRTNPVIHHSDGRVMLVHNAHNLVAVRESLEQHLKGTARWEIYQKMRGNLLESRTQDAMQRVFPGAESWHGFEYYVPATAEESHADPSSYTKRVEGDHLIVQDDVAVIVEDKAVAVSPLARAGDTRRLRGDLTGILKRASEQAGRLEERIEQDGGMRLHKGDWLDLSHVREIHTIAVSLDDLAAASTTTADLVNAGLLDSNHIPWTVSLHDLELITELIEAPAEFLLYLRRRRHPDVTTMFTAADELDLFLYFFEAGLYVEPNPHKIREIYNFLPPPTAAEKRRFQEQVPVFLTSRTDPLDAWHYSRLAARTGTPHEVASRVGAHQQVPGKDEDAGPTKSVSGEVTEKIQTATPKPRMTLSPLQSLIEALHARHDFAWQSIGATLLSSASSAQAAMARLPFQLLAEPRDDGRGRSAAIPFASSEGDGWLLVWMTRPVGQDSDNFERESRDYLRAKKYQMRLTRGAVFVYDEGSRQVDDVYYDGYVGELEPRLHHELSRLRPVDSLEKMSVLAAKRRSSNASASQHNHTRAKKRRGKSKTRKRR